MNRGQVKLFIMCVSYALFAFGGIMRETLSKWKAVLVALGIAVFLAGLGSGGTAVHEGGDHLYDPGEVVDTVDDPRPLKTFVSIGVFSACTLVTGALRRGEFPSG